MSAKALAFDEFRSQSHPAASSSTISQCDPSVRTALADANRARARLPSMASDGSSAHAYVQEERRESGGSQSGRSRVFAGSQTSGRDSDDFGAKSRGSRFDADLVEGALVVTWHQMRAASSVGASHSSISWFLSVEARQMELGGEHSLEMGECGMGMRDRKRKDHNAARAAARRAVRVTPQKKYRASSHFEIRFVFGGRTGSRQDQTRWAPAAGPPLSARCSPSGSAWRVCAHRSLLCPPRSCAL